MEKQSLKFAYIRNLKVGEVRPLRGKNGNFLVGTILWEGGYYSVGIFPDRKEPGKLNITVSLPVFDTYAYGRDYRKTRQEAEDNAVIESEEDIQGDIEDADVPQGNVAEGFEDVFGKI